MATTNTENYARINLMLVNGGTLLTKQLFLKRIKELSVSGTELTVDEFLEKNKSRILKTETGSSKQRLIFPTNGQADLDRWDLYLFCFMLQEICDLQLINKKDIEGLQKMRNKLCHLSEPTITDDYFKDRLQKLKVIFQRTLSLINDKQLETAVNGLVESYENGPLSLNDVVNLNHQLSRSELQNDEIISNQKEMMADIKSALSMLGDLHRKLPDDTKADVPGIQVSMDLKNCSKDSEKEILDYLEKEFNKTISNPEYKSIDIPNHAKHKISQAVVKTFQSFLSNGMYLVKVQQKCLLLTIKCKDIPTFINLVQDCIDGKFLNQLDDLRNAIVLWPGCEKLEFETRILPDDVVKAICKLASSLSNYTANSSHSVKQNPEIISGGDGRSKSGLKLTIRPNTEEGFKEITRILGSEAHSRGLKEINQEMRKTPDFRNAVVSFRLSDTSQSDVHCSSQPNSTTGVSHEIAKDIQTLRGPQQIVSVSDKPRSIVTDKVEKDYATGRNVPHTSHTALKHFYQRKENDMRYSSRPTSTTGVSHEIPKDIQTLRGPQKIVSDKPRSIVTDKVEKVYDTGRNVPHTSHTTSKHFYQREEEDAETRFLPLHEISEALKKESPCRKLIQEKFRLYHCLAFGMHRHKAMQEFANPENIIKAVDNLLNDHSEVLESIIPLLVDEYILGRRSFQRHRMSLTSLNVQKEYANCCLYLSATCMNTQIYMLSTDQSCGHHWEYFKPLFEYKGQPKRNKKYITMCMSPENVFYVIESTEFNAAAPTASGLKGIYKDALQIKNQDVLSELDQALSARNKCVGELVKRCHSFGVRVHGKIFTVFEPVYSRGFSMTGPAFGRSFLHTALYYAAFGAVGGAAFGAAGGVSFGVGIGLGIALFKRVESQRTAMTLPDLQERLDAVMEKEENLIKIIRSLDTTCPIRSTTSMMRNFMNEPGHLASETINQCSIVCDVNNFLRKLDMRERNEPLSQEYVGNLLETMLRVVVAKDTILNTMIRGNATSSNDDYY